jgi:hypothetical protein
MSVFHESGRRKEEGKKEWWLTIKRKSCLSSLCSECTNHSDKGWRSFHCREEHGRTSNGPECVLSIRMESKKKKTRKLRSEKETYKGKRENGEK